MLFCVNPYLGSRFNENEGEVGVCFPAIVETGIAFSRYSFEMEEYMTGGCNGQMKCGVSERDLYGLAKSGQYADTINESD